MADCLERAALSDAEILRVHQLTPELVERMARAGRTDNPAVYLRVVARLLPAHLLVQEARLDHLSDSELADYLAVIRKILGRSGESETNAVVIDEQAQTALSVPREDGAA